MNAKSGFYINCRQYTNIRDTDAELKPINTKYMYDRIYLNQSYMKIDRLT